jgi:hypothetical protein
MQQKNYAVNGPNHVPWVVTCRTKREAVKRLRAWIAGKFKFTVGQVYKVK